MRKPVVFAVVLNYKHQQDLVECLTSLKRMTLPLTQCVVVDNHSSDGSVERIRSEFPEAVVLETDRNLGYAGGMNHGIRYALRSSPEYILVMNGDSLVEPEFLTCLLGAFETCPSAGVVVGTIYFERERSKVWFAGGDIVYWRGSGFTRYHVPYSEQYVRNISFVSGCTFLVRTSALEQTGLFDEHYFMYLEDVDLSSRMIAKGYELVYVPKAISYHKADSDRLTPFRIYYNIRNRFLFVRNAPKGLQRLCGLCYLWLMSGVKLLVWRFSNPAFSMAAWNAIMDVHRGKLYQGRGLEYLGIQHNDSLDADDSKSEKKDKASI